MDKHIISSPSDFNTNDLNLVGFKVYKFNESINAFTDYNRRDFYKICISTGKHLINYAEKGIEMEGTVLFFGNPHVPYSWDITSSIYYGHACVFSTDFYNLNGHSESLQELSLFKIGGTPIFLLNKEQSDFIAKIFDKMLVEQSTDYIFKADLIRNYINIIIHEALKINPSENYIKHNTASSRITSLFFELLERQFPIENVNRPLNLKNPQDFARNLSIHINHLNKSIKEITGKPTTVHIKDRIIKEAKALLLHSDWSVSEIAYGLGFGYPSYFYNYFKRVTGVTPMSLRKRNT